MSRVCRGVSLCTLATWATLFLNCRRKLYAALVLFFLICISFVEFTKLSAAHQVNFQVLIYFGSEGRLIALCSYRAIVFPGRSRFILILFFFCCDFLVIYVVFFTQYVFIPSFLSPRFPGTSSYSLGHLCVFCVLLQPATFFSLFLSRRTWQLELIALISIILAVVTNNAHPVWLRCLQAAQVLRQAADSPQHACSILLHVRMIRQEFTKS